MSHACIRHLWCGASIPKKSTVWLPRATWCRFSSSARVNPWKSLVGLCDGWVHLSGHLLWNENYNLSRIKTLLGVSPGYIKFVSILGYQLIYCSSCPSCTDLCHFQLFHCRPGTDRLIWQLFDDNHGQTSVIFGPSAANHVLTVCGSELYTIFALYWGRLSGNRLLCTTCAI